MNNIKERLECVRNRVTELTKEYIDKGFVFSTYTMSGIGNGEIFRVDLWRKRTFIRICVMPSVHLTYTISVYKDSVRNCPMRTMWTSEMKEIYNEVIK